MINILNHVFGKKTPNSTAIAGEIERATAELAKIHDQLSRVMDGLATFDDSQHVVAETKGATLKRAAARLQARIKGLQIELEAALSTEAEAERLAAEQRFRQRVEAARHAVEVEAVALLREYDATAAKIGDIFARLDGINAEANAVNEEGRRTPGFEPVRNTDTAHRKYPDRQASERRQMRPVWVYPDGSERPATLDGDGNPNRPDPKWIHHYQKFAEPHLESREVVVERTTFRPGHYENSLSGIQLPSGFAGGAAHWPRK